jgi:membrane protease YdiL (CAAX protease family)
MKERFQLLSPFSQLIVLILVGAVSFMILSMLLTTLISMVYPDMPLNDLKVQQRSFPVQFMMMYYFPFQFGLFLIPSLIYSQWSDQENSSILKKSWSGVAWSVLLFVCVFLLLPFLSEINNWFNQALGVLDYLEATKLNSDELMAELIGKPGELSFIVGVLIVGLLTGIAEEFAFRKVLFSHMLNHTRKLGLSLLANALIFALLHFNFLQMIPLFMFGLVLGMVFYFSGSIWVGVVLHVLNNIVNLWWLATDSFPDWMNSVHLELTIPSTLLLMGLLIIKFYRRKV